MAPRVNTTTTADGGGGVGVSAPDMAQRDIPETVDTVVVGNGPAALLISYLLHGHTPYYTPHPPHPDPVLHHKLLALTNNGQTSLSSVLRDPSAIDHLTNHFPGSRMSYSTQALPLNILLDTLMRPNADTACAQEVRSRIRWVLERERKVEHIVLGDAPRPGGQWAGAGTGSGSRDIETLSYAEMLSLPGWGFQDLYAEKYGREVPGFTRPTQGDVADYFAAYPAKVGVLGAVASGVRVERVDRLPASAEGFGFEISTSTNRTIYARHVVLASGIFSHPILPPPLLSPLLALPATASSSSSTSNYPHLTIGSGFSAADTILSLPPQQEILHLFRWYPNTHPSPLRGCHAQAYPEYAGVYRRMKIAALAAGCGNGNGKARRGSVSPVFTRRRSSYFVMRDWEGTYEGLPNTEIVDVLPSLTGESPPYCIITIHLETGSFVTRRVSGLSYCVGRRGSLAYLAPELRREVLGDKEKEVEEVGGLVSGQTLRGKVAHDMEVAPGIFVAGSLAGDSLVRFVVGGCVYVGGRIVAAVSPSASGGGDSAAVSVMGGEAGLRSVKQDLGLGFRSGLSSGALVGCRDLQWRCCVVPGGFGEEEEEEEEEDVGDVVPGVSPGKGTANGDISHGKPAPNDAAATEVNGAAHADLHIDWRREREKETRERDWGGDGNKAEAVVKSIWRKQGQDGGARFGGCVVS